MYRVVFCPDESHMENARAVARQWALPIQTGDSERTKGMAFDRSEVRVLSVPTDRGFDDVPQVVNIGALIRIVYMNDYDDCSKFTVAVRLRDNRNKSYAVKTFQMDAHRLTIPLVLSAVGQYELCVMNGDEIVDMHELEAKSGAD